MHTFISMVGPPLLETNALHFQLVITQRICVSYPSPCFHVNAINSTVLNTCAKVLGRSGSPIAVDTR